METRVKYPRTPHLPWSLGKGDDDITLADFLHFEGKEVVVTEKVDGENTTLYRDGLHARSVDSKHHPSRSWVKQWWSERMGDCPQGMRICGENLFATHSLHYVDLPSYFLAFSMWEGDRCFSWDETMEWAALLGIELVPLLYRGVWDCNWLRQITPDPQHHEGYVVRLASTFQLQDFAKSVAKYVRGGHVQTDEHWMSKPVKPNELKKEAKC